MSKPIVVWHDNGSHGKAEGYTEYSAGEIEETGGLEVLLTQYRDAGIIVYGWN